MLEGPHSALNEEEFYDALESGLDELDAEEAEKEAMEEKLEQGSLDKHRFHDMLEATIGENIKIAKDTVDDGSWSVIHQDGNMMVYRKDFIAEDGSECDQVKTVGTFKGLTAKEFCSYFYDPEVRLQWESTVEKFKVLENLDVNTCIFHNLHKRVFPTAQRDACFLSHIRNLGDNTWMVQNVSVLHENAPDKYIRIQANVFLFIKTELPKDGSEATRDNISCNIVYVANVNPGGWAPSSVVKAVSKREYPKVLNNLAKHARKHFQQQEILL